ncbi:MAG: hydrogen gas-evolving membrane-bound hydrogenase subunit E [Candidatus Hadarchaeum sp.]|uniref:hydrogen gas-evolving membrane-bound hydrogenase subunit E n=1 Tax=Candidatus Hadarchaeum sp. TaxID=2883567 RepID=UPI003181A2F8
MMTRARNAIALVLVLVIGLALIYTVSFSLPPFGSFPARNVGGRTIEAVGETYLENATWQTGAANVVTTIVWGYRGYDTLGEATVLFTAVVGVIMIFRALGREE